MSDGTDLAGAIGTWVAVGVALIALLGVVAPLLVWRASRTERSRALAALDAGLAESSGFVTRGLRFGPNIRLFQRVRAPVLSAAPEIARKTIQWKAADPQIEGQWRQPSAESTSWVQLGHVLRSYGLAFRTADVLVIEDGYAVLPVSRDWIFVLGLVGRFGHRSDQGKWPRRRPRGTHFRQTPAGYGIQGSRPPTPGWMTSRPRWADEDDELMHLEDNSKLKIFGLIGELRVSLGRYSATLKRRTGRALIFFSAHEPREVGDLGREAYRVDQLFWLSVGSLPMGDGRVLSLEDPQPVQAAEDSESEASSDNQVMGWEAMNKSPAVHFDIQHDRAQYRRRRPEQSTAVSPMFILTPSGADPLEDGGEPMRRLWDGPRMFRMAATEARAETLLSIAEIVGAEDESVKTFSLEEVPVQEKDVSALKTDAHRTYVPHDRPWVRLTTAEEFGSASSAWFLGREDAQLLARALLELPVCAQGALMYRSTTSGCRRLLVGASEILPRLLARIGNELTILALEPRESQQLGSCMWNMMTCMTPFKYTRMFSLALFELDHRLDAICQDELVVQMAVQAVTLTNPEFRDLISQSTRNIKDCMPSSLILDLESSTLNVVSVMGMVQKFPVDIDVLIDNPAMIDRTANKRIPYRNAILLVLKASLKSAYLQTSVDSQPLYQMVLEIDEIAHAQ